MEGNNQLDFLGQLNHAITLMKYESSFDINAPIYEYLNYSSNLHVEDKEMYLEYEKYIHNIIEENQIRASNYDFHVLFDEEDHSYCIKYDIKAPACTATKELKFCTWCYTD
jgi:hypothetical protein